MQEVVANYFKMTTAEYQAVAMLLGLKYYHCHHVFCNTEFTKLVDPDTMEVLWEFQMSDVEESRLIGIVDKRNERFRGYHRR